MIKTKNKIRYYHKPVGLSILIILIFITLLSLSILEDNLAPIVEGLIFVGFGSLATIYLSNKTSKKSLFIFLLFFLVYLWHMAIVHFGLETLHLSGVYKVKYL